MTGKVALVTAGGSGMGAAAARKLAAEGFHVAILSSSGKGEALAESLGGIGVTGSNLVSALAGWPTFVSSASIVLAVLFSMAVGVFFGYYPARKAAFLDPIEALRYE